MASLTSILETIKTVISVANTAVQAGKDAAPYVTALYDTFTGKSPKEITQEDLDALRAQVNALHERFQEPLPPAEPDDLQ